MNKRHSGSDPSIDLTVEALLRSAKNDGPPPASLEKTAALLGVSVAPFATTSAASAAGLGGGAAKVASGIGATASSVSVAGATHAGLLGLGVGLGKVATLGALVAGGLGVTLSQTWEEATPATMAGSAPQTIGEAEVSPLPLKVGSPEDAEPRSSRNEEFSASPQPNRKIPVISSPRSSNEGIHALPPLSRRGDSLERELRVLSSARSALQRGEGADCLRLVEEYKREFPAGALSVEAAVLRVEALLITSGKEAAEREAEAFRKRMPHSMHLEKFVALGLLEEESEGFDEDARNP